jgi:RNA binding exosome subunit
VPRFFHDLTINTFVHATEDREKVIIALENLLEEPPGDEIQEFDAEGVHSNPISNLVLSYKRERDIMRILSRWSLMDFWNEAMLQADQRLDDDQVFHIRIDKQKACLGEIFLFKGGEPIGIKLKIATYPRSRDGAMDILLRIPDL